MLPYPVDLELFTEPGILELAIQEFLLTISHRTD
jgi:hypothetical protein